MRVAEVLGRNMHILYLRLVETAGDFSGEMATDKNEEATEEELWKQVKRACVCTVYY